MGYFSWLTADTRESIANIDSKYSATDAVYLLQPNGKEPIAENEYEGYGVFGGVDAYVWIAEQNLNSELKSYLSDDELRDYGIAIDMGSYYEDINDGIKYSFHHNHLVDEVYAFEGNYETIQRKYGKTPNQLIKDGTWIEKPMRELLIKGEYFPLKFSYDKNAVYEDLPASEVCPNQGYFY